MKKNERLYRQLERAIRIASDKYGHDIPYALSMDGSYLHLVIGLTFDDEQRNEFFTVGNDCLEGLRFMAENNRGLPDSLANASLDEFLAYASEHEDDILSAVRWIALEYVSEKELGDDDELQKDDTRDRRRCCQKLLGDLDDIYDAVGDACGQNVPYCASMNGSLFPLVVTLAMDEDDRDDLLDDKDAAVEEFRFLADGNLFPPSMKEAPFKEFEHYARKHWRSLVKHIRHEAESDYLDTTGEEFSFNLPF